MPRPPCCWRPGNPPSDRGTRRSADGADGLPPLDQPLTIPKPAAHASPVSTASQVNWPVVRLAKDENATSESNLSDPYPPRGSVSRRVRTRTVRGLRRHRQPGKYVVIWRRRPDLNRGWRFCRPLPYHLATAPMSDWVSYARDFAGAASGLGRAPAVCNAPHRRASRTANDMACQPKRSARPQQPTFAAPPLRWATFA